MTANADTLATLASIDEAPDGFTIDSPPQRVRGRGQHDLHDWPNFNHAPIMQKRGNI
jgi:hypothetical protein